MTTEHGNGHKTTTDPMAKAAGEAIADSGVDFWELAEKHFPGRVVDRVRKEVGDASRGARG